MDFPDVESTLISIRAPPTSYRSDGRPVYTLPVIVDPHTGAVISNPIHIAEHLERQYPARQIFPEGSRALQSLFVHYIEDVFIKPLLPIMVPLTYQGLPERARSHFLNGTNPGSAYASTSSNASTYSTPSPTPLHLVQNPLDASQRDQAWKAIQHQFDLLASMLDRNAGDGVGDGVVVMGRDVSYADFALCAVLIWIERMAPREWATIRTWNRGRWGELYKRCRDFMDVY